MLVGMCEVEPTSKGWFIKYIDKSPETLARQAVSCGASSFRTNVLYDFFPLPPSLPSSCPPPFPTLSGQAAEKKKKMDKDDEERMQEAIELQIERALASKKVCQLKCVGSKSEEEVLSGL